MKFSGRYYFLLFMMCRSLLGQQPSWVAKRPVDNLYYIGIGFSNKLASQADYLSESKNKALMDLATAISITIQANQKTKLEEVDGRIHSEFVENILTGVTASIQEYEIVDTWDTKSEHWVYIRLNKEEYYENNRNRYLKAVKRARADINYSDQFIENDKIVLALSSLFDAACCINPIELYTCNYYNSVDSSSILKGIVTHKIKSILERIHLCVDSNTIKLNNPTEESNLLNISAMFKKTEQEYIPIFNLPISGYMDEKRNLTIFNVNTNEAGLAVIRLPKKVLWQSNPVINCIVSLDKFIVSDSLNTFYWHSIFEVLIPSIKINLRVKKIIASIVSYEYNLNTRINDGTVESFFKERLSSHNITFSNDIDAADYIIKIFVKTRYFNRVYNQTVTHCDVKISVIDKKRDLELYQDAVYNVKGVNLNSESSGLNAISNFISQKGDPLLDKVLQILLK